MLYYLIYIAKFLKECLVLLSELFLLRNELVLQSIILCK